MWNGAALNLELFTSTDSRLYLRRWCVGVDRLNTNSSGSAAAAWAYCVIHLKPGLSGSTRYQSTVESFTTVMCVYRWWAIPPPPPSPFLPFFFLQWAPSWKDSWKKGPVFLFSVWPKWNEDEGKSVERPKAGDETLLSWCSTPTWSDVERRRLAELSLPLFPSENFLLKRRKYDGHIS